MTSMINYRVQITLLKKVYFIIICVRNHSNIILELHRVIKCNYCMYQNVLNINNIIYKL